MERRRDDRDERVSLDGLDAAQALKALLAVDPDAEPTSETSDGLKQPGTDDAAEAT